MSEKSNNIVVTVMVNYHSLSDTIACIESFRENESRTSKIVIVDNSQPNQLELKEIQEKDSNVHVIFSEENVGFGRANNIGIQWCLSHLEFSHLLLINNDTLISCDAISKLIPSFDLDEKIGISTGLIMYENDREIVWYGGADINLSKGWPDIADLNKKITPSGAGQSRFVSFASGCLMLFSRKCIEDIQGFDDDFFMYCEDLELCLKARKLGYKIYYNADSKIFHKVHGSSSAENKSTTSKNLHIKNPNYAFLFYHLKSNQYLAMRKHLGFLQFVRFNFYFWARYNYFVIRKIFRGEFSIFKVSFKTKMRILKILFTNQQK